MYLKGTARYRLPQKLYLLFFISILLCVCGQAQAETLRMVEGKNGIARYAKGLLRIALSKLPDEFQWDESTPPSTEARVVEMLLANKLDILWYGTSKDFESRMLPIRIPIYRGLLGYRIFMIKAGTQNKFQGINTIGDLDQVSIAQGRFWEDTKILESNGIEVLKVTQYASLFHMLDGDRYDAFPRGVHEPWEEMPRWPDLALEVEKNLMLSYTSPFYFFVNKNNTELAEKVERGLRIAIADGSFNSYFLNDKTIQAVLQNANVSNRHVIKLNNPSLPQATPMHDKDLWFDPYSL